VIALHKGQELGRLLHAGDVAKHLTPTNASLVRPEAHSTGVNGCSCRSDRERDGDGRYFLRSGARPMRTSRDPRLGLGSPALRRFLRGLCWRASHF
jgi:hypothetical protein